MKTAIQNEFLATDSFVVEIDGEIKSGYGNFSEALRAGMELKQKFPHSQITVHDAESRK
jgi:hypothetical protein